MQRRVFCCLFFAYLAVCGGHVYSGDGVLMLRVTESIALRGDVSVRPIAGFETYATARGTDNRLYSKYGVALSIATLPLYGIGMLLETVVPASAMKAYQAPRLLYYDRNDLGEVLRFGTAALTNAWITALTFAYLASILVFLGMQYRTAAAVCILGGLTGLSPFYAKTYFSEPLAGLFLVLTLWAITQAEQHKDLRWLFFAGLYLGASMLTRVAHGILLIPAAIALVWWLRSRKRPIAIGLLLAAAGFAIPLMSLGAYNYARFGHLLETGYGAEAQAFGGDPLEGFLGLLMSPGRGLFWFVPWSIIALISLKTLWKRHNAAAIYIFGSLIALMALYSPWHMWEGGWCYGPRFLVPIAPLLLVPAALGIQTQWQVAGVRYLVFFGVAVAVAIAATSVHINYLDFHFAGFSLNENWNDAMRWSTEWSPLSAYWSWPERSFLLLPRLLAGDGGLTLRIIAVLIVTGLVLSVVSAARWLYPPTRHTS